MIQYDREKLIRWGLIALAIVILALLIFGGIESWNARQYERKVNALEAEIKTAEAKAKEAEDRAEAIEIAIETKYEELRNLQGRADKAEVALRTAKGKVVTLKEEYETIRYLPLPSDPVSCADACANLAAVNYSCK